MKHIKMELFPESLYSNYVCFCFKKFIAIFVVVIDAAAAVVAAASKECLWTRTLLKKQFKSIDFIL